MAQETVHLRGEGGGIHEMALPLPESIADRLANGALQRVNPDGSPWTEDEPRRSAPRARKQQP